MARWDLPLEDCLRAIDGVDRGELVPTTVYINRAPETMLVFKGAQLEAVILAGQPPGIALDGRKGGLLVRRGYAKSRRIVMDATGSLNFYWITEAGREAARRARETA